MNDIKKLWFLKPCLFSVLILGIYSSLFYYNVLSIGILEKKINIKYQDIVDITKRFYGYYINSNTVTIEEGIYNFNNVGIIVNKTGEVKVLSPAINLLSQSLLKAIDKKYIWTIAVIEKLHDKNTGNSYFLPLRDIYIKFNDKTLHDSLMLDRIVKLEGLDESYKGFHNDDIRITEVYTEDSSNERIHSVIYPIYLKSKLVSVIIVDIKEGWNESLVTEFSDKRWVFITRNKGFDWATFNIKVPYTLNSPPLMVSLDIFKMLSVSFYASSAIYLFSIFLYCLYLKINNIRCNDRMTGFFRRDFIESKLNRVEGASFLIIDIDHFKQVNDNHGHAVGDRVIQVVTQRIKESIREDDIAIRWGGEEFVIAFYHMKHDFFHQKAEMIRERIESERIESMHITISIGGSKQQYSELAFDAIKRADMALYQSKNTGRNRVTLDKNEDNA
ncbi:GGDEF domain-containing protein [Aliivibrio sp. S4TY2]|uniref:GGDEF domain-containing protein n=1 Tax=unclassified Aliivibrio TaxID=2645654 RepID=UPI002377DCAE|nr:MULTISPECIES: GGDEF domain-containing protein [unclassified Aliivibrio]MDD9156195.1 GGDEF domain-containing protein [Aliivibrio sp. S4TY2]MDD9160542.1 GGDEF domain-containing protein [Aliivibrio sp. S4TY1]MDD9163903.1 GGDEF domain-containing protein [Aliivibrio sp. S4MY2]MDD9168122.1 GGDEF domain-containing protein [Aliivibrio sp. S4MY4]MDD9185099.1 GGDEF domain-containing protein [Aliivibrio sp. S4MY3]